MSEGTTYSIELSPSAKAKCKKCKGKIEKGAIRIGTHAPNPSGDYAFVSWQHVACFTKPRKLKDVPFDEFVDTILQGDDSILVDRRDEVLDALQSEKQKKKTEEKDDDKEKSKENSIAQYNVLKWKKICQELLKDDDEDVKPSAKKKMKKEEDDVDISNVTDLDKKEAAAYKEYSAFHIDGLKDVLRWNRQTLSGTKDILIQRIVDGHLNGRLGLCPSCLQGKLKLSDDFKTVMCPGYFDEEASSRVTCFYSDEKGDVKRLQPWFQNEPTEKEEEMINKQLEQSQSSSATSTSQDDKRITELQQKVKDAIEWDVANSKGVRNTTKSLYNLLKTKLVFPGDDKAAMTELGKLVLQHRKDKSLEEIIVVIVQHFSFVDDKIKEQKRQADVSKKICKCDKNGALFLALNELSSLYFKEKNAHAGNSYKKVAQAIKELNYEITEDNALGLGKGKTKVAGIGKSSAEKIHEFVSTGTIEKLEEKKRTL